MCNFCRLAGTFHRRFLDDVHVRHWKDAVFVCPRDLSCEPVWVHLAQHYNTLTLKKIEARFTYDCNQCNVKAGNHLTNKRKPKRKPKREDSRALNYFTNN